jgi:hypothetical protein
MSQGVEFVRDKIEVSDADRDLVLAGNAIRLFNLPIPA